MKRKAICFSFITMIIILLGLGVCWMCGLFDSSNKNNIAISEKEHSLIMTTVHKTANTAVYKLKGTVVRTLSSETNDMTVDGLIPTGFDFYSILGHDFKKGEVVLNLSDGSTVTSDMNGKLVDYCINNDNTITLSFLNYDSLMIETFIDEKVYCNIDYKSSVTVIDNKKTAASSIYRIGYEVQNGRIPLLLYLPYNMLPGTEVNVELSSIEMKSAYWLNEAFVFWDGSTYYVLILKDQYKNEYEKVCVTIGDSVEMIETDGNVITLIEITSGVAENDLLCIYD